MRILFGSPEKLEHVLVLGKSIANPPI